ncbi:MAG: aminopeptidase [Anaerolineae bacterium]|nr:aminopeptidase [Anaerolineae bacterium]
MQHDYAAKLARVLTHYCVPIAPGQLVVVMTSTAAEPLIEALLAAVMERGGHLETRLQTTNSREVFMARATDAHMAYVSPVYMAQGEHIDVLFRIDAPHNTKALSTVDPLWVARRRKALQPYQDVYQRRVEAGDIRYCISVWPTLALAQDAEMGFLEYTAFFFKAAGLNRDDPVAYWQALRDQQQRLVQWLAGKTHVEVRGPGIDMTFDFGGRMWVSCHGDGNFPDGEIYTSPVDDSVNGHVEFNLPTIYAGREVTGVRLTFKDGVVVEASAEKGEDFLLAQLAADEGAKRLGEFAIGTNWGVDRVTGNTLLNEKMGGTIHMALGGALEPAGGINQSVIHWDMVHDMRDGGEVWVDGTLFYKAGEFQV